MSKEAPALDTSPASGELAFARDYVVLAEHLLTGVDDVPGERARRIAGIYACFFLEDPLLHSWAGLAAFVALQLYRFLDNAAFEPLARGNRLVYASLAPNILRFRDGVPVDPPLLSGFARLAAADRLAQRDLSGAYHLVNRAVEEISVFEQREVVQEVYDAMSDGAALVLSRVSLFRIGWDAAAPVLRFRGADVRDPQQRLDWMHHDIMPAWERARREHMEWLRADVERVRRFAGVRLDDLPPRWPGGLPPTSR